MEIRQLRFFLRAAELGSITRAAHELRIAQPALSRQIRQLEEALGIQLFIRDGRGVALTSAGSQFHDRVAKIIQDLENACVEARDQQKVPSGEIRLGISPHFGGRFSADLVSQCEQLFPDIGLLLFEGFSDQIATWIQSKQIDLGFLFDLESYQHLNSEFRFRQAGLLVGSADGWRFGKTVPFQTLGELSLITTAPPSWTRRRLLATASEQDVELTFSFEIDSLATIKDLVSLKSGYAVFTRATIYEDIKSGKLAAAKIVDPEFPFDVSLASAHGVMLPLPARHVIKFLKEFISTRLADGHLSGEFIL
jgi:LysR family nitrogen assimilation transcriptional regulator